LGFNGWGMLTGHTAFGLNVEGAQKLFEFGSPKRCGSRECYAGLTFSSTFTLRWFTQWGVSLKRYLTLAKLGICIYRPVRPFLP